MFFQEGTMSRYLRLNLMELARIFQPGAKLELSLTDGINPEVIKDLSLPAYVTYWVNDQISLTLPEMERLKPNQLALLAEGRIITLQQTGGISGSNRFKCKITALASDQKQLTVGHPVIMTHCERRRGQRVPLNLSVTYQVLRLHSRDLSHLTPKIGIGASQDLGCYGMNMITELFLPIGITLLIHLTIDQQSLAAYGIVRNVKPLNTSNTLFATGIKFIDPDPDFQKAINHAISKSTALFKKRVLI
jgi:hypothetical protein